MENAIKMRTWRYGIACRTLPSFLRFHSHQEIFSSTFSLSLSLFSLCYSMPCTKGLPSQNTGVITFSYENRNVVRDVLSDRRCSSVHLSTLSIATRVVWKFPFVRFLSRSASFEELVYREGNYSSRSWSLTSKLMLRLRISMPLFHYTLFASRVNATEIR